MCFTPREPPFSRFQTDRMPNRYVGRYSSSSWGLQHPECPDRCDERVRIIYAMSGCFLPKPVACSNACAICRTLKSSLLRPTIWTPTGSPSGVKPPGTEAAGLPVAEIYKQDFIQSM